MDERKNRNSDKALLELLQPIIEKTVNLAREKITLPEIKLPIIRIPEINFPEFPAPQVTVNVPDVIVGDIKVPTPIVNYTPPAIRIPDIKMPDEMNIRGWVQLQGVTLDSPLPVQIRDKDGRPVNFDNLGSGVTGGWAGGKGIGALSQVGGRLQVDIISQPVGSSGLTDTELRASSVPVEQVSGSIWSVSVIGASGSSAATIIDSTGVGYSGSNPLPVYVAAGSIATTAVSTVDSTGAAYEGANPFPMYIAGGSLATSGVSIIDSTGAAFEGANPFPVNQTQWNGNAVTVGTGYQDNALRVVNATDAVTSVYANNPVDNGDAATALRMVIAGNSAASVSATQVGTWNIATVTTVTGVTNSVSASVIDSSGVAFEGANPFPINIVTNATSTVNVAVTDSGGIQYSGSNPFSVNVAGSADSTLTLIARTANPTAAAAGADVRRTADTLGRQVVTLYQVRDLIGTAYVSISTGTATTLKAASAGEKWDLVQITASSNTTYGTSLVVQPYVDVRSETNGGILFSMPVGGGMLGAGGSGPSPTVINFSPPLPQIEAAGTWTVDMNDITGTTANISALFIRNV